MFVNIMSRNVNRQSAVLATTTVFVGFMLLTVLSARPAICKPASNTELPQILQAVSEQLPAEWHPRQMHSGQINMINPVQRLVAGIDRHGVRMRSANGFTLHMQLTHYGFSGNLQTAKSYQARMNGVRVEVRHDADLSEWFINTPLGVEQGFYLRRGYRRPAAGDGARAKSNF